MFELSGPTDHRVFALSGPDRVVVDLPIVPHPRKLTLPEAKGVVTGLRTGPRPNGELRVVLELNRSREAQKFLLTPNDEYGYRLVVDLLLRDDPRRAYGRHRAGGDGRDSSSRSTRVMEARIRARAAVTACARKTSCWHRAQVGRRGRRATGMRSVLIRNGDYFVSHRKRMEIAHGAQADLFVSIHADSYRDSGAKGATVYVLSNKGASDEASLLLAQRENASDLIGGVSLSDKDQLLARVLLDLSQNAALSASTSAAQRLIRQMATVTAMRRMQVQQAPFLVLKSPDIPSVLVETAYISNPREEAALRNPAHQAALARALRAGIVDYFVANPPPGSYLSVAPALRSPTAPRDRAR